MIPVAIVLLVLLLLFAAGAIVSNGDPVVLNVFVAQIPMNLAVVFVVGMATALAFVAAFALLWLGLRRQRAAAKAVQTDTRGKVAKSTKGKDARPLEDKSAKPLKDKEAKPLEDRDTTPLEDRETKPLKDKGGSTPSAPKPAPKRTSAEDTRPTEGDTNRNL